MSLTTPDGSVSPRLYTYSSGKLAEELQVVCDGREISQGSISPGIYIDLKPLFDLIHGYLTENPPRDPVGSSSAYVMAGSIIRGYVPVPNEEGERRILDDYVNFFRRLGEIGTLTASDCTIGYSLAAFLQELHKRGERERADPRGDIDDE